MPIDASLYKDMLARWTSGVTVLTTSDEDGRWQGITASSFSSVSVDPPLILVCVAKRLYIHGLIEKKQYFAINILAKEQEQLGKIFAGMVPGIEDRFSSTNWDTSKNGCPILPDALAWIECKLETSYDGADHSILVGNVLAGNYAEESRSPLLYHNRQWGYFQS